MPNALTEKKRDVRTALHTHHTGRPCQVASQPKKNEKCCGHCTPTTRLACAGALPTEKEPEVLRALSTKH